MHIYCLCFDMIIYYYFCICTYYYIYIHIFVVYSECSFVLLNLHVALFSVFRQEHYNQQVYLYLLDYEVIAN